MTQFLEGWARAAYTTIGFFWMALWAFALGYVISSMIQVFVTRERMQRAMGTAGARSVGLATFFGFISSSCSFAALASAKALFKKGAGLIPSLAFLLASTNLVIELGIVIAVFLSWHFIVGEYVGGLLLILVMWLFVRVTHPDKLIQEARQRLEQDEDDQKESEEVPDWRKLIRSREGWERVGTKYVGEWVMVWKDVTVGFTVAGIIAAFVPAEAFQWLFVGTGDGSGDASFLQIVEHTLVGPLAAFLTFIGSMGNIPLAAVLYSSGVSMAGIMAFIFSDLVVFPVLRINAKYYGWKMSLYVLAALLVALVVASLLIHYGFAVLGMQPLASGSPVTEREFFEVDYTLVLNAALLLLSGLLVWLRGRGGDMQMAGEGRIERILLYLSLAALLWLAGGMIVRPLTG